MLTMLTYKPVGASNTDVWILIDVQVLGNEERLLFLPFSHVHVEAIERASTGYSAAFLLLVVLFP
jgi:hypothetical protein